MFKTAEEGRSASIQILRFSHFVEAEPVAKEIVGFPEQVDALLQIVNHAYVAVVIGLINVGELEGGAGVAAIQDDEESAVWGQLGDEMLVERVAVDLAAFSEVNGTDGIEDSRGMHSGGISDLTAVA
jgi:hypothetical protein